MSTNFYWHEPECETPCKHCPGADELHIGHFSGGSWSFQGHFNTDDSPRLVSFADWATFLRSETGRAGWVEDENGTVWNAETFLSDVEAVPTADRRRQYNWLAARHDLYGARLDRVEPHCDWLDEDGFSFHGGDFT